MEPVIEPIDALVKRFDQDHRAVTMVSFSAASRDGQDPMAVFAYLRSLGIRVAAPEDLLKINEDQSEEELHAYRVVEGIAVSIASDGLWLLYVP